MNSPALLTRGVRIFQEGVDRSTTGAELSKNAQRRTARGARKLHKRRNQRRYELKQLLERYGLLPNAPVEFESLMQKNPYELRARGLHEKLSLFEFGRALYHLNQRRGFKSNRKAGESDGKVASAISELQQQIEDTECRTLGEYLHTLDPHEQRIRCRYTHRAMYEDEFKALWDKQREFYPDVLSDNLKRAIYNIIFYQRPLKIQKNLVGLCEFEKKLVKGKKGEMVWSGKKRSPKGTWYAQQFRMLSEVNNLEVIEPTGELRKLTSEERSKLLDELQKKKERTFDQIRKLLGMYESVRFNYEEGGRDKLKGNGTEAMLRTALKTKLYEALTIEQRDSLISDLLFEQNDEIIRKHCAVLGFYEAITDKVIKINLESSYLHLSQKAICKLLPYLGKGKKYSKKNKDEPDGAIQLVKYDDGSDRKTDKAEQLPEPPQLRNPIVQKALYEVRKVVNAIVREYGKPSRIRIEMARDLKASAKQRQEARIQNARNRKRNDEIRKRLENEYGIANPSRDDVIKYRLWEECNHICPYTGKTISAAMLFSAEVEIEHILPYSRSLDDSYSNKTLCMSSENSTKNNRTPFEAYHSDEQKYAGILAQVRDFAWEFRGSKMRKFRQKELELDSFIQRQLNDTRYISTEVAKFLEPLVGKDHVQVGKGQMTATLRHLWGMNNILHDSGEKTREDHRHHAVDAVVTALSTPAALKQVSSASKYGRLDKLTVDHFPIPWDGFRKDVEEAIRGIVVSHRVMRKVRGALHEETAYGALKLSDRKGQSLYAVRKPVSALTHKEITQIGDEKIRSIIQRYVLAQELDPKNSTDVKKALKEAESYPPCMPSGQPIKRVRLHKPFSKMRMLKNKQNKAYRGVQDGSNHHMVIYEYEDKRGRTKRGGKVVSMFDASQRAKNGERIVQASLEDGQRFVVSLALNEMLAIEDENGPISYYRVQKLDAANLVICLREHTAANIQDNQSRLFMSPGSFRGQKVVVSPIGLVYPAND